jgi:hypothetical protein
LADRFGPERLEVACTRALRFDDPSYTTVKRTLEQGLDLEEIPSTQSAPLATIFARPAEELVGDLLGGEQWS